MERISLTVETTTGAYEVAFGPNHHIGAVLGEVLSRCGYSAALDDYDLVYSQERLDPLDTLASSPVVDGATLFLESNPAGGI